MDNFHKTENIKTHEQLKGLIAHQINFLSTGDGKPDPLRSEFRFLINDDLSVKKYTWIDKTKKEIESEKNKKKYESDLLIEYQSNLEKWRTEVIKPWSMQKLHEWIDITYARPLEYDLSEEEEQERIDKRLEILEYHNQNIYIANPAKPEPPSYI